MQKMLRDMVRDATHDLDDVLISLQAGQQTANRLLKPVAIQKDLSIVALENATLEVLEVIQPECYVKDGSIWVSQSNVVRDLLVFSQSERWP